MGSMHSHFISSISFHKHRGNILSARLYVRYGNLEANEAGVARFDR